MIYMIYELAHVIKEKCSFLWNFMEWGNAVVFSLKYGKVLDHLDEIVNKDVAKPYEIRVVKNCDIPRLQVFFSRQPKSAYRYFNPHGFDETSIKKVIGRKSFLTFILVEHGIQGEEILGYAFMRSFVNEATYRGYMVDVNHRGRGLAKILGLGMNRVGDALKLKMYKSISPENLASMKVTQKVCDTEFIRILKNGDYLIKCKSKFVDTMMS